MIIADFMETDADGEIRLAGHRIRLIDIAARYEEGHSPETIVLDWYPTLSLALVHKAIGFYLENELEVRDLLNRNRATIAKMSEVPQSTPSLVEFRRRIEARRRIGA
jgi:uncharacterized protein (DUF433 family)